MQVVANTPVRKTVSVARTQRQDARARNTPAGRRRMANGEETDDAIVKSARRVLQIFEYFDEICRPASTTEIARSLGYPLSSAAALLGSLAALSYLSYDRESRKYVPTVRIALLGDWVNDAIYPADNLKELMTALNRQTGLSVLLGIRNRIYVQYLHALQGNTPIRYQVPSAKRRLLTRSTMGRMILSALPESEIELVIRHCNAMGRDADEMLPQRKLKTLLRTYADQKYAYSRDFPTRGASLITTLLPVRKNAPLLTIAIAGPNEYIDRKQKALLKTLQDQIARYCGVGGFNRM